MLGQTVKVQRTVGNPFNPKLKILTIPVMYCFLIFLKIPHADFTLKMIALKIWILMVNLFKQRGHVFMIRSNSTL